MIQPVQSKTWSNQDKAMHCLLQSTADSFRQHEPRNYSSTFQAIHCVSAQTFFSGWKACQQNIYTNEKVRSNPKPFQDSTDC